MQLELATTDDIITELRRRRLTFLFASVPEWATSQVEFACQGRSVDNIRQLIRNIDRDIQNRYDRGCTRDNDEDYVDTFPKQNNGSDKSQQQK